MRSDWISVIEFCPVYRHFWLSSHWQFVLLERSLLFLGEKSLVYYKDFPNLIFKMDLIQKKNFLSFVLFFFNARSTSLVVHYCFCNSRDCTVNWISITKPLQKLISLCCQQLKYLRRLWPLLTYHSGSLTNRSITDIRQSHQQEYYRLISASSHSWSRKVVCQRWVNVTPWTR